MNYTNVSLTGKLTKMINTCIAILAITLALTTSALYLKIEDKDNSSIVGVVSYLAQNVNKGPIVNITVREHSCLLDQEDQLVLY